MTDEMLLAVLYIDDDDDVREIVRLAFGLDDAIDLRSCPSAEDTLAWIGHVAWRPDIILLDVAMPDMSGEKLMRRLIERYDLQDTPFVFVTAHGRDADIARYAAAGAAGVIEKPFDPMELAAQVRDIHARH